MIIAKIPFTTKQFLQVFANYNQAIYPIQFALIIIAIVTVFLAVSRKPLSLSGKIYRQK
jgi:Family of unknown function (DUF6064)